MLTSAAVVRNYDHFFERFLSTGDISCTMSWEKFQMMAVIVKSLQKFQDFIFFFFTV